MPVSIKPLRAAILAGSILAAGGVAFAQQPQPPRPANPPRPAGAPAAPAQPAAPQPPASQRVELIPSQAEWTKICGKDQAVNKEICFTTRDFAVAADQQPVLALAIYDIKGDAIKMVRLLLPHGLLLKPGIRFTVDRGAANEGAFETCFQNGCFAESKVQNATIDNMKKGTTFNITVKNQVGGEVVFAVPLAGFGKAFDGAAIDPKVLEEQQKQLQDQLQKQADEERKRLEGQAPAPAAAPAPAPR